MKVVHLLATEGLLTAVRGRTGGVRLAKKPNKIKLGSVVKLTEPDFKMVECFACQHDCRLSKSCKLPNPINEALQAFLAVLDRYTLEDMLLKPQAFLPSAEPSKRARGPRL